MMRVLVACEYSGRVREAFRALGHDAWSCDLLEAEDRFYYHYQCDVRLVLDGNWDLMIAHPPARDIDNIIKPVSDALVAAGVVTDDSLAESVSAKWADNLGGPAVVVLVCAAEQELAA